MNLTEKTFKKYKNHVTHLSSSADIFFHWKSANSAISRNTDIDCVLINNFYFFKTFFDSLKVVLIIMVTFVMMSAKMTTLGLLEIKLFLNKGYDVIISVRDVTNKILSPITQIIL